MRYPVFLGMLLPLMPLFGCAARPVQWAQPVRLAGVGNLYQVDDGLYRSANPSTAGWKNLEHLGIRTAVCLERLLCDRRIPKSIQMVRVPIDPLWPTHKRFMQFLRLAADRSRRPMLITCLWGSDRSSWACAMYRVVVQGWSKDEAVREMTQGGFHSAGPLSLNFRIYLAFLDVPAVRRKLGIPAPATQPTSQPSTQPASQPSTQPATQPASRPTSQPASGPTSRPSSQKNGNGGK